MRTVLICTVIMSITATASEHDQRVSLPQAVFSSDMAVEEALLERRSVRKFSKKALTLDDIAQLLWAAQGITGSSTYRTAPSAGALYPIEMYLVAGNVEGLAQGVYRYRPESHDLVRIVDGDRRRSLATACWFQTWLRQAPAVIVTTGVFARTARKYGERSERYVQIEAGAVAQNIYLQATSRGLGTVIVGAFRDTKVKAVLGFPEDHEPLTVMPVGHYR